MSQMGLFAALAKLVKGSTVQEPLTSKLSDAEGMRVVSKDALKSTTPPASEMFGGLEDFDDAGSGVEL